MKYTKLLILIFISLINCKGEETSLFYNDFTPIIINASIKSTKIDSINEIILFKSVLELVDIDKQDYIASIDKLIKHNNKYYILDKQKSNLFVFANTGRFIKKIGNRGNGPGEFSHISDFLIDPKNNVIYILSGNDVAINSFTLDGEFINKVRFPEFYPKTFALKESLFYFDCGYAGQNNYNVIITNLNGKIIKRQFPYPDTMPDGSFEYTGGINNNMVGSILYTDATSSTIYGFNSDKSLTPFKKYIVNLGAKTWNDEDKYDFDTFLKSFMSSEISFLTNEYFETKRNLVFNYIDGNKVKRGYHFFENPMTITHDNIINKELLNFFKIPIGIEGENVISFMDYENYSELKNKFTNIDKKIKELDSNLFRSIEKFNEDSNPILLFYEIKN